MNVTPSNKVHSQYPLNQSPLYKVHGRGQLEKVLGIRLSHLDSLLTEDNYRVWLNKKSREIQAPIGRLEHVHRRIGKLFARIEIPDYVYSKKGRSYAANARQHIGDVPLGKTDISKFYPSTLRQMVRQMFVREFLCANDVANILADLCCYQQKHLPTGSPISGYVAFFAARSMFDDVEKLATNTNSRMTLYVDDITLSGPAVTKRLIAEVRKTICRHDLKTKGSKTKTYSAFAPKRVTGAVIIGNALQLPNERHKRIWEARIALQYAPREKRKPLLRTLRGRLQEAKQILVPPMT